MATNSATATSPANGLKNVVDTAAVAFSPWITSVGGWSAEPDTQITFMNTGGKTPEPSIALDYPSVQVLVRGSASAGGYEAGYQMCIAVRDALLGLPTAGADYPELVSIIGMGHIVDLGRDDKVRPRWSFNFQLYVAYDASGYRD